jgi:hypothetical protein
MFAFPVWRPGCVWLGEFAMFVLVSGDGARKRGEILASFPTPLLLALQPFPAPASALLSL